MPTSATPTSHGYASTPLGRMVVITIEGQLAGLNFDAGDRTPSVPDEPHESETLHVVSRQLDEYFQGVRTRFDIPLRLEGTRFQLAVWAALMEIPYGQTSTYARLAEDVGRPAAARAVGAANGRNPISIIVPCHRLIGAGGALTGYGGGLDRKRELLDLENRVASRGGTAAGAPAVSSVTATL
jgi:methylated-DNA-[protein]-cysteine S-methyltransferase